MASDGIVWFSNPIFGIVMPNQGALAEPELDHRSVYRFDPATGALDRTADFEQPNGLAFSRDGRTLYVSNTSVSLSEVPWFEAGEKHEVIAFDVAEDGALSNGRFFCHTDDPDEALAQAEAVLADRPLLEYRLTKPNHPWTNGQSLPRRRPGSSG